MASPEDRTSLHPVVTSGNTNLVLTGTQPLQQEAGSRVLPVFLIQGTAPQVRMATHVVSNSQNVPYTVRPTFVRAGPFAPTSSTASGKSQTFMIQTSQPNSASTLKNRVYLSTLIRPGMVKPGENPQKLVFANRPLPTSTAQQPKLASLLLPMTVTTQASPSTGGFMKITGRNVFSEDKGSLIQPVIHNVGQPLPRQFLQKAMNSVGPPVSDATRVTPVREQCPVPAPVVELHDSEEESESDDVKERNQDLSRCFQEVVDALFATNSSNQTNEVNRDNCDIDDHVTVIRVTTDREEPKKELPEDDVKIELVQPEIKWEDETEQPEVETEIEIVQTEIEQQVEELQPKMKWNVETELPEVKTEVEVLQPEAKREVKSEQLEVKQEVETEQQKMRQDIETNQPQMKMEIEDPQIKPDVEIIEPVVTIGTDDVQKEMTPEANTKMESSDIKDFDPMEVLVWKDGIGSLPGSNLKFCMNEFGMMEMVEDSANSKPSSDSIETLNKEDQCTRNVSEGDQFGTSKENMKSETVEVATWSDITREKVANVGDKIYCCESCGVYGVATEFVRTGFCSHICEKTALRKKAQEMKKQRDLLRLKQARKIKRAKQLLELQQKAHEGNRQPVTVSAPTSSFSEEDDAAQDPIKAKLPVWQTEKKGFSWNKYLDHCKAKGAPVKLFKDPFPYSRNGFKVGMKLEGIDPQHPAYYCVLTVTDVVGYRMRVNFDGYSEMHDFWVNADSMNIFPVGWCEKTNRHLHPPCGYKLPSFNWSMYLKQCQAQAAPRQLFTNKTGSSVCPSVFRVGMKLEAVDRWNSFLVCVATVADVIENRILVHLDGRDNAYDFWADATSPYIHPVGWCRKNGQFLTPPLHWKPPQSFSWDQYLKETTSQAVPARAFKQRQPRGFREGMKLECVDRRVPMLVRVATVEDVYEHRIRIKFDGWSDEYSYWLDDDSPDIHPPGWCQKTGHPLESPLMPEDQGETPECPTPGCRGKGHINGQNSHSTVPDCPYAPENRGKDGPNQDRLLEDKAKSTSNSLKRTLKSDRRNSTGRPPKVRCIQKDEVEDEESDKPEGEAQPSGRPVGRPPKQRRSEPKEDRPDSKRKKPLDCCEEQQPCGNCLELPDLVDRVDIEQVQRELHESIVRPGLFYRPLKKTSLMWSKHSNLLHKYIDDMKTDVTQWSPKDVTRFVKSIPSCEEKAAVFTKEKIDGDCFMLMSQQDFLHRIGMKLGPAIKLYNAVIVLRLKRCQ